MKLKESMLSEILRLLNKGYSQEYVANHLGVTQGAISYFLKANNVKQKWVVE